MSHSERWVDGFLSLILFPRFLCRPFATFYFNKRPGAGCKLVDTTESVCPRSGATWMEPNVCATYLLFQEKWVSLFRVKLDSLRSTFNMQILRLVMLIMVWNRRWNRMRTNWPWNNFNVMVRIVMNWVVKPVMDWKNWIMWFVMDRNWVVDQRLMMMMICSPWGGPPRVQWLASIWVPTGHWTPWFIYDPRSWLGFLLIFDLFFFGKCAQRQRTEAHNFQQLEWRIRVVNNNSIFTNSMQRYKRWTCFLVYCSILRY